jgi:membrane-bound lytic murein transglycosylase D
MNWLIRCGATARLHAAMTAWGKRLGLAVWLLALPSGLSAQVGILKQPRSFGTTASGQIHDSRPDLSSPSLAPPLLISPTNDASIQSGFVHSQPLRAAPFPVVLNRNVERYLNEFLAYPVSFELSVERSRPYLSQVAATLEDRGVPRNLVYLAFAESCFSKNGAGPWQLTRPTARRFGLRIDNYLDERRDPILSTRAAADYLAMLHEKAGDWRIAVVGWNAGDDWVDRLSPLQGAQYSRLLTVMPHETRELLNRFMAYNLLARDAQNYGLERVTYSRPSPFRTLPVRGGTLLGRLAQRLGLSLAKLRDLNPALLRDRIPPYVSRFNIRIPAEVRVSAQREDAASR